MEAYGYTLNKRGDIVMNSAVSFTKLSDAINAKQADNDGLIVFVAKIAENEQTAVNALLAKKDAQLYPTKKADVFVLGNAKRAVVNCAIE